MFVHINRHAQLNCNKYMKKQILREHEGFKLCKKYSSVGSANSLADISNV